MKMSRKMNRGALLGSVSVLPIALLVGTAHANPSGGSVEAGSASIENSSPTTLLVNQTSDKAIINWQSFDIDAGETTRFVLPDSGSVTLNRDFSGNPSEIYGTLESNGQLFLVNRSGILFGPNARVDVAGLVATTHDIGSDDFLAGNLNFSIAGDAGAGVVNQGQITVNDLGFGAFVAPHVRNDGAIVANMGKVEMASASGFTLDLHGDRLISFLVENPNDLELYGTDGQPITALVENSGSIIADGGQVALTASAARGVVDSVINTDGIIQANTVEQRGGKIILGGGSAGVVRTSGQISAKGDDAGETGGTIIATGEYLLADEFARFDASGWSGGGKLMFGGDYLGGNTTNEEIVQLGITLEDEQIETATVTMVDFGAEMTVDALVDGEGGKLITWGDEALYMGGTLTAKGGSESGNGGFIETSASYLQVLGQVDTSAPNGAGGTWLLDPLDITIEDIQIGEPCFCGLELREFPFRNGGSYFATTWFPTDQDSIAPVWLIESALNNGNTVVITTFGTSGSDDGDIRIVDDITKSSGGYAELRLLADDDIIVASGVDIRDTSSGDLLLEFYAGGDDIQANQMGRLDLNGGSLILQAADDIRFSTTSNMPDNVTLISLNRDSTTGIVDVEFDEDQLRYYIDGDTVTIRSGGVRLRDPDGGNVTLIFDRDVYVELQNYAVEMDLSRGRDLGIGENSVRGIGTDYEDAVDGIPELIVNGDIGEVIDFFNPEDVSRGVYDILYAYDWYAGTGMSPVIEGSSTFDTDIDFYVVTYPPAAPDVEEIVEAPVQSPIELVVQEVETSTFEEPDAQPLVLGASTDIPENWVSLSEGQREQYARYEEIGGNEIVPALRDNVGQVAPYLDLVLSALRANQPDDEVRLWMMEVLLELTDAAGISISELRTIHYARNINQDTEVPYLSVYGAGWSVSPETQTAFHVHELPENLVQKWTHTDGREYVFIVGASSGLETQVSDGINDGTFNYGPVAESPEHILLDIIPWIMWGTSVDDTTTFGERLDLNRQGFEDAIESYLQSVVRVVGEAYQIPNPMLAR